MFCFLLRGKSKYREETKRATQEKQKELPVLDQSSLVDMAGSTGITMPSSPPPKKAVETPIGLMTRAGAKAIQHEVTLCLEVSPLDMTKDDVVPNAWTFCIHVVEGKACEEARVTGKDKDSEREEEGQEKPLLGRRTVRATGRAGPD